MFIIYLAMIYCLGMYLSQYLMVLLHMFRTLRHFFLKSASTQMRDYKTKVVASQLLHLSLNHFRY